MVPTLSKDQLSSYYVPGTVLALGMQQWTKTNKILSSGCLCRSENHMNQQLHSFKH